LSCKARFYLGTYAILIPAVIRCSIMTNSTTLTPDNRTGRYAVWLLVLLAVPTGVGLLLDAHITVMTQSMLYVLAVVVGAYVLPAAASMACAVLAVVGLNFFFVPPRWTFAVDSQEHLVALVVMMVVALVISQLSQRLRRNTALARLHARRAEQLQTLASELALCTDAAAAARAGARHVAQAFDGPTVLALQSDRQLSGVDAATEIMPSMQDGLRAAMREAAVLGPGTGRWPGLNAWYLPLGSGQQMHGAVCVQNIEASDDAGREHAQALCALIAQALERLRLGREMAMADERSTRQQLQNTFLAAVSHDLRTPLAAMVGNASSLRTQRDKMTTDEQATLLDGIVLSASHLSRLTENTLQLVQLANSDQPLALDWESMEEIAGACVARQRQAGGGTRLRLHLAAGLPLVRVNAVLIAQLLDNLLDNALKYSEDAVDLKVRVCNGHMQILVQDRGPVIPKELQTQIFEPYSRGDRSGKQGAGLGLALCRAIALAHGGRISLRARQAGGNSFRVCLTLAAEPPLAPPGDAV
jgi:two-component system sensor histidine kinase KdpD